MPVDSAGNRADMMMGSDSTVDRMNPGRFIEQYINGASRDLVKSICTRYGIHTGHAKDVLGMDQATIDSIFQELFDYYSILSTRMPAGLAANTPEQRREHVYHVMKDGIYLYLPPENEVELLDAIQEIEKKYAPVFGPVTYTGYSGVQVTTKTKVRIASVYIIMLEKTGDDWSSVNSGLLQHFGILALTPKSMQYSFPYRNQAVRAIGEAESRIYVSYAGPDIMADIMDRNNNSVTHTEILRKILSASHPTNIDYIIDRKQFPLGDAKPLQIVKHLALVAGWRFKYRHC